MTLLIISGVMTAPVASKPEGDVLSGSTERGTATAGRRRGVRVDSAIVSGDDSRPHRGVDGELLVSDNGRYLVYQNGMPFFWLADTAWGIFGRLSRSEITYYLTTRKHQGFTVIFMVAIFPVYDGINSEGVDIGELSDPTPEYFELVDYAIEEAERLGMYTALWPIWSRDQHDVLTVDNAQPYGEFLGERYASRPIIWVFGGDDPDLRPEVWDELARGIAIGKTGSEDYSKMLMTYHPAGQQTSLDFHDRPWLDFHIIQTGHDSDQKKPYEMILPPYRRTPTKPVVEGEAMYEKHSDGWDDPDDIVASQTIRNYMYWSVLSGGMGYSYGHWYIWPFVDSADVHPYTDIAKLRGDWKTDYLKDEVAGQVRIMRDLMESRAWYSAVPDLSFIDNVGDGMSHIQAMRGRDDGYMIAYTPNGRHISANLTRLAGDGLQAFWYDPRTGNAIDIPNVQKDASVIFQPPSPADWVLVVTAGHGPAR